MLGTQYCRAMRRVTSFQENQVSGTNSFFENILPHISCASIDFNPNQVSRAVQVSTEKSKIFYFRDICQDLLNRADTEANRDYKIQRAITQLRLKSVVTMLDNTVVQWRI